MKRMIAAAAVLATFGATDAVADDDFWLAARAGTQGLGLEATWRPVPYLDLRAGFSRYDYDTTRTEAGIAYDAELGLESLYATVNARIPASPITLLEDPATQTAVLVARIWPRVVSTPRQQPFFITKPVTSQFSMMSTPR